MKLGLIACIVLTLIAYPVFGMEESIKKEPPARAATPSNLQESDEATKQLMLQLKQHLEALSSQVYNYGSVETSGAAIKAHAEMLRALAEKIPVAFKNAGTDSKIPSDETIWRDKSKFEDAADKLNNNLSQFANGLNTEDKRELRATFRKLDFASICAGCHDLYRKGPKSETTVPRIR